MTIFLVLILSTIVLLFDLCVSVVIEIGAIQLLFFEIWSIWVRFDLGGDLVRRHVGLDRGSGSAGGWRCSEGCFIRSRRIGFWRFLSEFMVVQNGKIWCEMWQIGKFCAMLEQYSSYDDNIYGLLLLLRQHTSLVEEKMTCNDAILLQINS